jgi:hypothetical protein
MLAGASLLVGAAPAIAKPHHDKGNSHKVHVMANGYVDINRNGVADFRERFIDRNRNRVDDRVEARWNYGSNWCPPGLAKKNNGCVPPGQFKREFREGQRVNSNYRYWTPYASIPVDLRTRYDLDDDYRYIYRNNYIYAVDPRTDLVTRIISLLL